MNTATCKPTDLEAPALAPPGASSADPGVNLRALLGLTAWSRLTPAIRQRFDAMHDAAQTTHYIGTMTEVRASRAGRLLANVCRLFGTPLAPFTGRNVPVHVAVYDDERLGGTVWARTYYFAAHYPVTVSSAKRAERAGGNRPQDELVECLPAGLAMRLRVFERDGALHFLSNGYLWRGFGLRIALPSWLTPGRTHVVHEDLGDGYFRFALWLTHPWLGELIHQDGRFEAAGAGVR